MYYRNIVRQIGYLPELYGNARSEKYWDVRYYTALCCAVVIVDPVRLLASGMRCRVVNCIRPNGSEERVGTYWQHSIHFSPYWQRSDSKG